MIASGRSERGPERGAGGFTLTEVLVAAALALLVVGLALQVLNAALRRWERAQGEIESETTARLALDQVERDLQGTIVRAEGGVWLAASLRPHAAATERWVPGGKPVADSLDPATAELRDARFGVGGVWLRMVTHQSGGRAAPGVSRAPAAVAYALVRRSRAGGWPVYALCRAQADAADTFAAGYDLSAPAYLAAEGGTPPGGLIDPASPLVLAERVVDFGLRFYAWNPETGPGQPTLATLFPRDVTDVSYEIRPARNGAPGPALPVAVDVFLRVLSPAGARRLAAWERGTGAGDWWKIVTGNSTVFTRRIRLRLPAQGL